MPVPLLLALLAPRPALASGESEEAEISFQLGLDAYAAADYRLALARFLTSNRLAPNPAVAFNIARCYARIASYAEAYRWYLIAQEGLDDKVILRSAQDGLAAITPQVVVYDLLTDPPGATVFVDSKDLGASGTTPLRLALAESGDPRTFIFARDGYDDSVVAGIAGKRGQTIEVRGELRQVVGTVAISGTEGAEVRLGAPDGPILCTTPCEALVQPGPRVLYVVRDGFRDGILQFDIVADARTETTVLLQPITGSVLVSSSERGALVEIDGQAIGFTPTVAQGVPVGQRLIRISKSGYAPTERTIDVPRDGQVELTDIELVPLGEVVAVSRRAERVAFAPSSVTIITRDELDAFRYPTIYEALRGVRGFALTYDSIYGSAAVRGLGQANDFGNRLLLLSDGAILNDNILYQSFIGYDGRVDLQGIEQIEIVRGPGSVLYGTGAVSGVVNLVGEPRDAPNDVQVALSTFENVFHGGVQVHQSRGDVGVRASLSGAASPGRAMTVDPRGPAAPLELDAVDSFEGATTTGRVWLGDATFQWYHGWRTIHIPTGVYGTFLDRPASNYWVDHRTLVEGRYEPRITDTARVFARAYFNRYTYDGQLPYPGFTSVERYVGVAVGAEVRAIVEPVESFRLQVGASGDTSPVLTLTGEDQSPDGTAVPYLDESESYWIAAGYALMDLMPIQAVRLTLGSRIDYWSTFGGIALSPRAALVVLADEGDVIKVMGGRAFRAPSIYELTYNIPTVQVRPDYDGTVLRPEQVWSGEIEYSHDFDEVWTGLVGTHASHATDLVETVAAVGAGPGAITYRNSDLPINILGADVELRRAFRGGYMMSAYYSALDSRYTDDTVVPNVPSHAAGLKVIVPAGAPTQRLALRVSLEAPRRIDLALDDTTDLAVVGDLVFSGGVPELGFDYAVGFYNLLDARYAQPLTDTFPFRTMPQAGRSLRAFLSKRF